MSGDAKLVPAGVTCGFGRLTGSPVVVGLRT